MNKIETHSFNITREKVLSKIQPLMSNNRAVNIEKSIFNWAIKNALPLNIEASWSDDAFIHMYVQRAMDIIYHIKKYDLNEKIDNQDITSKDIWNLKHNQFNKTRWSPVVYETDETDKEGIFQCRKCQSKKTTYYSLQTRSADEPMTNFITCLVCGYRWKV